MAVDISALEPGDMLLLAQHNSSNMDIVLALVQRQMTISETVAGGVNFPAVYVVFNGSGTFSWPWPSTSTPVASTPIDGTLANIANGYPVGYFKAQDVDRDLFVSSIPSADPF